MALTVPPAANPKSLEDNFWSSLNDNYKMTVTESGNLINTEWVGYEDPVDYRQLNLFAPGFYTFRVNGVTSSMKFTLYQFTGSSKLKKITRISVSSGAKSTKNLLLDSGVYYICCEGGSSKKSIGTWYNTDVVADTFTRINNADDDYANLSSAYTVTVNQPGTVIDNDWVGFGDKIDYRKLDITTPGAYSFSLSGLSAKAKLTLYTLEKGKLKKVTSITGNTGKVNFTKEKLLNAGTYYLAVEAPGWKKGQNTAYSVTSAGQVFTQANNMDDVWSALSDDYSVTIKESGLFISNDWVGFGDTIDWRRINITSSGRFSFYLNDVNEKLKLTVYSLNPVKQKLKKLSSVTVSKGTGGIKKSLELLPGTYYISVEAVNAKKGKNSFYSAGVSANFYSQPEPGPEDPSISAIEIDLANSNGIRDAIISYETQEQNYTFTVSSSQIGNYGFIFTADNKNAQMVLYKYDQGDNTYDIRRTFAVNDMATLALEQGKYLIEISSPTELSKHQEITASVLISPPYLAASADLYRTGLTDTQKSVMTIA